MEQSRCCGAGRFLETDVCDSCKENSEFSDWEEQASERMKVIAQNGNDGLHYAKEKIKKLWNQVKVIKR